MSSQETKKSVKSLFSRIEKYLPLEVKLVIGAVVLGSLFMNYVLYPSNDVTQSSVKIVGLSMKSGGSGVILQSNKNQSEILTNAHVCGVVENGGLVVSNGGTYMVSGYKRSELHDLCMVRVNADLGINTSIASNEPIAYKEQAFISGHPRLLPNVVTSGHFSGTQIIAVLTGFKKCSPEEAKRSLACMFFGGNPIITSYESTLVTATIMPGSSGSGVYNNKMQLTGLAFAGSQGLGYAWTVPHSYLVSFVNAESQALDYIIPNQNPDELEEESSEEQDMFQKVSKMCEDKTVDEPSEEIEKICDVIKRDILWRKD